MPTRKSVKEITLPPFSQPPTQNTNMNFFMVGALIIAAFLLGMLTTKVQYLEGGGKTLGTTATQGGSPPKTAGVTPTKQKITVDAGHLPIQGNKNAKVEIVEFADFQCPFCERFYQSVGKQLIEDYVKTGKAKLAFRHYAFLGQESTWASEAAECANEQGKFWEYHNYLYEHQGQENSGAFSKEKLEGFAQTLGLDTNQFNSCLESDKYASKVSDDVAAGQKAGVNGTPTTFVNGTSLVGAQPYSIFKETIDKELAK